MEMPYRFLEPAPTRLVEDGQWSVAAHGLVFLTLACFAILLLLLTVIWAATCRYRKVATRIEFESILCGLGFAVFFGLLSYASYSFAIWKETRSLVGGRDNESLEAVASGVFLMRIGFASAICAASLVSALALHLFSRRSQKPGIEQGDAGKPDPAAS